MIRWLDSEIVGQLLVDVLKRRGNLDTRSHREGKPLSLVGAVIRVLAEDEHFDAGERRQMKRGKHIVVRRIHRVP